MPVPVPPRTPHKPSRPFVSASYRPPEEAHDGLFRLVLITSGSVASIKVPDIVAALAKNRDIDVQIVATKASTHFYSQNDIDSSVRKSLQLSDSATGDVGYKVWTDTDEWSDWRKVGDPILHIELRRWADLVVVAPCSADLLAKVAGGLCDDLATSLMRALSPSTPVVLCPAMNTHMYQHRLTAKHLTIVQDELGYLVSGPQGGGRLACGDDGPGKMTDWRDIVSVIEGFAHMFHNKQAPYQPTSVEGVSPALSSDPSNPLPRQNPPTPNRSPSGLRSTNPLPETEPEKDTGCKPGESAAVKDWRALCGPQGGDGRVWQKRYWMG
ncbi:hypothetical protein L202_02407 [Cryptococcus amylolentus CBS 6039]|uniref:Flavoprotein domain-containing protein n=2 Tax=Cryptococcus amylolentus TaxID=104669 RepID=A0A1E3I0E8_9TREE|nr:hypothetical protein L202_02407 [Cryptococcus amylolentus CBS 6039]ODN82093.1 hypothetical protein L202_02407 [Cryptococcus amylolentus CBS 6039]ODO09792.1 hypothetical protein I350_02009 [Cryptococcus amylolentus CBS 6273]